MTALATTTGMDRQTGKFLSGIAHVRQSILDVLTTAKGSVPAMREYGSDLPDLIDAPNNPALVQTIFAATATAIAAWYPFVTLTRISLSIDAAAPGQAVVQIEGYETGGSQSDLITLAIPLTLNASAIAAAQN